MSKELTAVFLVTMVTWIGLFAYLWIVDRSLRRLEREEKEKDDL